MRPFPTLETVPEDKMSGDHTTNDERANTTFVSTTPSPVVPSYDNSTAISTTAPRALLEKPQSFTPDPEANTKSNSTPPSTTSHVQPKPNSPYMLSPSPELVNSIFPTELPRRPDPKPSPFQRLLKHPIHATPSRRDSKDASSTVTQQEFETLDIDDGPHHHNLQHQRRQHQYSDLASALHDSARRIKFWTLILGGTVLCIMIGMLVYLIVTVKEVAERGVDLGQNKTWS